MEYCELGDLSLFIKKREKLSTNPATHEMARKYPGAPNSGLHEVVIRHFLKQLASALKFLRERNYVHRDVKPQNLLLLPSRPYREQHPRPILTGSHDSLIPVAGLPSLPMLKLADFGFARVLPSTSLADTLCGSPLYMAPEILRYERYDAKADLWSVGTVLYEMVTGRPPFRARNHVELLRKIEAAEDVIKFPREAVVSSEMKGLVRALLKRNPVERLSFENFFAHQVVTGPISGLVEDDLPRPERRNSRELTSQVIPEEQPTTTRRMSIRRYSDHEPARDATGSSRSPRDKPLRSPQLGSPIEGVAQKSGDATSRLSYSPRHESGEGLGIRRPPAQTSVSAPNRVHRLSNASQTRPGREVISPTTSQGGDISGKNRTRPAGSDRNLTEEEKAAQDVAFMRDYVVVEKTHVEMNAFADEMAANPRMAGNEQQMSPKSGQMIRRATQQGAPTSTTGAVPAQQSRAVQIAQGRDRPSHDRRGSFDKGFSGSPGSAPGFISKAIQDASLRLFGYKISPHLVGKGHSPPQLYSPYPAFPAPSGPAGLIGDGKQTAPVDDDARAVQLIEDLATRSDCVYGFAEVKYKQLVPLAPSMDHGLGGVSVDEVASVEDGLTLEAIVTLSEEALVLYVKALTLLAKSMEIARYWWSRKNRGEASVSAMVISSRDANQHAAMRINSAVQWVRGRFNEVLEKTEIVRLKLTEAQKQLPEDHPSHPSNHGDDTIASASSTAKQVFLTPGISAEKLMYDRALEMSRTAAIDEITNENLPGCETYYVTAIRMLEAVLDNDDEVPRRKYSGSGKEIIREESSSNLDTDDQQAVYRSELTLPPSVSQPKLS
jgi:serine/threonine-protein kinase ULK2